MMKDLGLREFDDRLEIVKKSMRSLDNKVHIIDNDNRYLYDIKVSIDDVEFGVAVRSGNFEKTKNFIDYRDKLTKFVDKINMPVIIFYINKNKKDTFISPIINYEVGELTVKDKIVKRGVVW